METTIEAPFNLRDEALRLLNKEGDILETARDVSRLLREAGLGGVVIGGVAVVLHGYVRTTMDVDVLVAPPLGPIADALAVHGYRFDPDRKEFSRRGVPVHLVTTDQAGVPREPAVEIDGVVTVTLADLIGMKLRSGLGRVVRTQDLADVVALIRHHRLTGAFAARLDKPLRPEFRKLVRAIRREERES